MTKFVWPRASAQAARRAVAAVAPDAEEAAAGRLPGGVGRLVSAYFAGQAADFSRVPLDLSGEPPFRARVLATLAKVGYGRTLSYGELARRVGCARGARAVGQAMARNPIPIIVPCHRVLAAGGRLGGYGGGLAAKRRLLDMERKAVAAAGR